MQREQKKAYKNPAGIQPSKIVDNFSEKLGGEESGLGFQVEFVEIKPAGNQSGLPNKAIQAPPPGPGVGTVPFHFSKGTLGLDGAVYAQQGSMDELRLWRTSSWKRVSSSFRRMVRFPFALEHCTLREQPEQSSHW